MTAKDDDQLEVKAGTCFVKGADQQVSGEDREHAACPLCNAPLVPSDLPIRTRRGAQERFARCSCGAECWIANAADGTGPFVAQFTPNRPLRVRVVRPGAED